MSSQASPEPALALAPLRAFLARFLRYAGAPRAAGALALLLLSSALEFASLYALSLLLQGLVQPSANHLPGVLALFAAATATRIFVHRWRDLALIGLRLNYVQHLRDSLYASVTAARWSTLARMRHSDILGVLNLDIGRIDGGLSAMLQAVVTGSVVLVTVTIALITSPAIALPALLLAALLGLALRMQARRAHRLGKRLSEANRSFLAQATDFLGLLKLVKAQGGEDALLQRFSATGRALNHEQLSFVRHQTGSRAVVEAIGLVLMCALVLHAALTLQIEWARLVFIFYLLGRVFPLVNQMVAQTQWIAHMLPAWDHWTRTEQEFARGADAPPAATASDSGPALSLSRGIVFDQVGYTHEGAGRPALSGISIELPARGTTALIGPSGAGKTTLADLLLGLLGPTEGRILIDGRPLDAASRRAWQSMIAYVPQENLLLPQSVRDNLVWGGAAATDAELWDALETSLAADFVRALPAGLDSLLGEQGVGLSGGERQRLMLARALTRKPRLLVLDEATSHLDAESEQLFRRALHQLAGRCAVLLIAHRLDSVRDAAQIVMLERGGLVAQGRWDALMASQPRFAQFVSAGGIGPEAAPAS